MSNQIKLVLCLIILAALAFIGCPSRITDGGGFTTVSGTVIDSLSGEPIDSARITMVDTLTWAHPVLTDSLGHWEFEYQGAAGVTFYCQKEGFQTRSAVVSPIKTNQRIKGVDFLLSH